MGNRGASGSQGSAREANQHSCSFPGVQGGLGLAQGHAVGPHGARKARGGEPVPAHTSLFQLPMLQWSGGCGPASSGGGWVHTGVPSVAWAQQERAPAPRSALGIQGVLVSQLPGSHGSSHKPHCHTPSAPGSRVGPSQGIGQTPPQGGPSCYAHTHTGAAGEDCPHPG